MLKNGMVQIIQNDEVYRNELSEFGTQLQALDAIYGIRNYTRQDWETVMRSAHKAGICLFPNAKKK